MSRDAKIGKVPATIQAKLNKVTDLYADRKIVQLSTAQNLINDINQQHQEKGKGTRKV